MVYGSQEAAYSVKKSTEGFGLTTMGFLTFPVHPSARLHLYLTMWFPVDECDQVAE